MAGEFGSTVSRYWASDTSSMRPPVSEIEPLSCGVSMGMRWVEARTARRLLGSIGADVQAWAGAGAAYEPGVVGVAGADGGCTGWVWAIWRWRASWRRRCGVA